MVIINIGVWNWEKNKRIYFVVNLNKVSLWEILQCIECQFDRRKNGKNT